MAIHHAQPGEVIDVKPLAATLATAKTRTLFRTRQVELIRIVMHAGKVIPEHEAPGEIIVQCVEGRIAFTASGQTQELGPGQMLYLAAEEPHAVQCLEDASFLVTIMQGDAS